MTRCASCNGIIAPTDSQCYVCGDPVPGGARRKTRAPKSGGGIKKLAILVELISLGLALYSYMNGQRPLLLLSGAISLITVLGQVCTRRAPIAPTPYRV